MTGPSSQAQPAVGGLFSGAPNFAEMYEQHLVGPIFRPWAERLIERTRLTGNERVLDVACGTGIVARLVRNRLGASASVVAVDKSPLMLATARRIDGTIDWREGDALSLPVADEEQFGAVFCHQGLQFFPDKLAGLREMRRVLSPGGRIAVGVWRSAEENTLFGTLDRAAERFVGPIHDIRHSFPEADALRGLLFETGFQNVEVASLTMETRLEIDPAVLARMNAMAVIGMSERGKELAEEERTRVAAAIVEASLPEIARFTVDGTIRFQTSSNIATARA